MIDMPMLRRAAALFAALLALGGPAAAAEPPAFASDWATDHTARSRLIGGGIGTGDAARLYAGIEVHLDDGWKTYWRNPGSSGVPPRVDWQGSENLAEATLLFPAPKRFTDRDGDTIGYKSAVVLPVAIKPKDPSRPVVLKLALEYGVCREVCIPVQPSLTLTLPPGATARPAGALLSASVDHVPRALPSRRATDPAPRSIRIDLSAPKPRILIEADFPAGAESGDIFLEAPDGLWIPLAKPVAGGTGPSRRFEVDLTDGADLADLKGREIRMTLVSSGGQSETTFKFEPTVK